MAAIHLSTQDMTSQGESIYTVKGDKPIVVQYAASQTRAPEPPPV